jgi:hypothetical protein
MRRQGAIVLGDGDRRPRALGRWGRWLKWALVASGVLSCAGLSVNSIDEEMRVRQAELDVSRIGHAARLFRADEGRCPTGVGELAAPPDGRVPYLQATADPWGRPYRIVCPGRREPAGVDVASGGPDGDATAADNITSL